MPAGASAAKNAETAAAKEALETSDLSVLQRQTDIRPFHLALAGFPTMWTKRELAVACVPLGGCKDVQLQILKAGKGSSARKVALVELPDGVDVKAAMAKLKLSRLRASRLPAASSELPAEPEMSGRAPSASSRSTGRAPDEAAAATASATPVPEQASSAPAVSEGESHRMLVFERSQSWTKSKVEAMFSPYGELESVRLGEAPRMVDGNKVVQRAAAVTFRRLGDAQVAKDELHGQTVDGVSLNIKMKPPQLKKSASSGTPIGVKQPEVAGQNSKSAEASKGEEAGNSSNRGSDRAPGSRCSRSLSTEAARRNTDDGRDSDYKDLGLSVCAKAASKAVPPSRLASHSEGSAVRGESVVIRNLPEDCGGVPFFKRHYSNIQVKDVLVSKADGGPRWAIVDCKSFADASDLLKAVADDRSRMGVEVAAKVVDLAERNRLAREMAKSNRSPRPPGCYFTGSSQTAPPVSEELPKRSSGRHGSSSAPPRGTSAERKQDRAHSRPRRRDADRGSRPSPPPSRKKRERSEPVLGGGRLDRESSSTRRRVRR
mmetsp:Transcript_31650/g.73895  ORF Transcript_31650/g.73895 Transcript_31650/m.73895 type:complete len:546 (+) Transcript_31650:79-1716(+)